MPWDDYGNYYEGAEPKGKLGGPKPFNRYGEDNSAYDDAHKSGAVDTDTSHNAIHHTLGTGRFQAAPGNRFLQVSVFTIDFVGDTRLWFSPIVPERWAPLLGQAMSVPEYPELFDLLGYRFGGSGGSFLMPDARNRFLMGYDGNPDNIGQNEGYELPWRLLVLGHYHDHNISIGTGGGGSWAAATTVNGSHNHGGGTALAGGVAQRGSGSLNATAEHSHGIPTETGHAHIVSGTIPSHNHSADVAQNEPFLHAFLGAALIMRVKPEPDPDSGGG